MDRDNIFKLYKTTILKESPDNISIGGKVYNYNDINLDNYTGYFDNNGNYAMSKDAKGHGELQYLAKTRIPLMHNFGSDLDAWQFVRRGGAHEFRIWLNFDVFSSWSDYDPRYVEAALEAIKRVGKNPEGFAFDVSRDGAFSDISDAMSYDDFVGQKMNDRYIDKDNERTLRKIQDERMLADYKLGNLPQKDNQGFYKRVGD